MSECRIHQDINLFEIANEYAERVIRVIDEQTLARVEYQLAEYDYVKVVRCRDCEHLNIVGKTLHVCDECIDKAKELVDKARKEGGEC